jgi:hypothetical protein
MLLKHVSSDSIERAKKKLGEEGAGTPLIIVVWLAITHRRRDSLLRHRLLARRNETEHGKEKVGRRDFAVVNTVNRPRNYRR